MEPTKKQIEIAERLYQNAGDYTPVEEFLKICSQALADEYKRGWNEGVVATCMEIGRQTGMDLTELKASIADAILEKMNG